MRAIGVERHEMSDLRANGRVILRLRPPSWYREIQSDEIVKLTLIGTRNGETALGRVTFVTRPRLPRPGPGAPKSDQRDYKRLVALERRGIIGRPIDYRACDIWLRLVEEPDP